VEAPGRDKTFWSALRRPRARTRILLGFAAALTATLLLGVALATATAPVVSVEDASSVRYTTAAVEGHVNPEGQFTQWRFEYATQADFSDAQTGPSGATETAEDVSGQVSGLAPGQTYHLRLVANNADGETEAVALDTFETEAVAKPGVELEAPTSATATTVHLSGLVNPNAPQPEGSTDAAEAAAFETAWHFECTPGCGNPSGPAIPAGDAAKPVQADLTGLEPNTEYTVKLVASDAGGQSEATEIAGQPVQFTTATQAPELRQEVTFEPTETSATVRFGVNPHNSPLSECRILYGIGAASGNELPCAGTDEVQQISVRATAGKFRLTFGGDTTGDIAFDASAAEVEAELRALPSIGSPNVTVTELLEEATRIYSVTFSGPLAEQDVEQITAEDGTEPLSGAGHEVSTGTETTGGSAIERLDAAGNSFAIASAELTNLTPGSEYHFKLVAASAAGSSELDGVPFPTFPAAGEVEECPNEARRVEQHSTFLPDCRAYEMVSPLDKNGGDVEGGGSSVISSGNGNGVVFASLAGFADTAGSGSGGRVQYLARRGSGGWETHAITPAEALDAVQVFLPSTLMPWFSDDLGKSLLSGLDLPAASEDIPDADNIYLEDTATGALDTLTRSAIEPFQPFEFHGPEWGSSAALSHVALVSRTRLVSEAPAGVPSAYEWVDGTMRLAGILPDGSIPPEGSTVPLPGYRGTVSPDGSALAFISPPANGASPSQLYLRRDGSRTVWVSESENDVEPIPQPAEVNLQAVSSDGRHVIFTTTSRLLSEDTNEGSDLYLYTEGPDPAHESNLTLISRSGNINPSFGGVAVAGLSDDASTIVFQDGFSNNLYLWADGTLRLMSSGVERDGGASMGVASFGPGGARLSPNGKIFAFFGAFSGSFGGSNTHALTGQATSGHVEMYSYDAPANTLSCVSCPRDGSPSTANVRISPGANGGTSSFVLPGDRPNYLAADGRHLFFSTAQALLPADTNGAGDTYSYDTETGRLALISTGNGEEGGWFADASPSGNDVFLVTRQELVGADTDNQVDLYDARTGGGFPEPAPTAAPCSGEVCQPGVAPPPPGTAAATGTFSGPGNPPPHRRRHRRHHHHPHKHHHHQRSGHLHGRAGR